MSIEALPWRGPGPGRPDLPLPPGKMPLPTTGACRKRWRYLAAFSDELMLCAARVQVGPSQTFWAVCDRENGELHERTRTRAGRPRRGLDARAARRAGSSIGPDGGDAGADRGEAPAGEVRGFLRVGEGSGPSPCARRRGRLRLDPQARDVPVSCDVRVGERAGRSRRAGSRTSRPAITPATRSGAGRPGVGTATTAARSAGTWSSGINDPPERSERAIWVDGEPCEPGRSSFDGLEAIGFDDGARLEFSAEAERRAARTSSLVQLLLPPAVRDFSGTLPGGIELESGLGVMEHHDARW